jgi:hypothetical protein
MSPQVFTSVCGVRRIVATQVPLGARNAVYVWLYVVAASLLNTL